MLKLHYASSVILALLLVFCTKEEDGKADSSRYGGVVRLPINDPVETFDPLLIQYDSDRNISGLLFDGLVCYTDNMNEIKPSLAKSWEISKDGLSYKFHLRENVYFQNDPCFPDDSSRKFTNIDVLNTFLRLRESNIPQSQKLLFSEKLIGLNEYINFKADSINGIKLRGQYEIEFNLKQRCVFIKLLTSPQTWITSKRANDFYKENFALHPVGTGPFQLVNWNKWQKIILRKNENYWDTDENNNYLPYLDGIEINVLNANENKIAEFAKGNYDLLQIDKKDMEKLRSDPSFDDKYNYVKSNSGISIRFLTFSFDNENCLTNSKKNRKLLALSFNREQILDTLNSTSLLANSLVPEHFLETDAIEWYSYYEMIPNTTEICDDISIAASSDILAFTPLEKALKKIGAEPIKVINPKNYYSYVMNSRPDIFKISMYPSYPDPEEYYAMFYSKNIGGINLSRFSNAEYDKCYLESLSETNLEERNKYFLKMEEILKEEVAALYMTHSGPVFYVFPKKMNSVALKYVAPDYSRIWLDHVQE